MKKAKNNHERKKIKAISLLAIIIITFLVINGIRIILNKQVYNESINLATNITTITGTNPTEQNQDSFEEVPEKEIVATNSTCAWVKTTIKAPITEFVEDIEYVDEVRTKNMSYTYSNEEPLKTIKKTIRDNEYNAITFFKTKNFESFYRNITITSWISSTDIAFFKSIPMTAEIKIKNTDSMTATYNIYRVYQPIEGAQYYDSYNTTKLVTIPKGQEKTIQFEQAILCIHLDNKETNWVDYYKKLTKKYNSQRLDENDFIVFEYLNEPFACFRPYFVVVPEEYSKEYKVTVKRDNSHYSTTLKNIDQYTCK
ncbi:hypothetical protein JXM83_07520 [Candidatus Woesearchaeota archaeon]|nr:hypothetical protein [Candidatus Woesearchaeota archaeon]